MINIDYKDIIELRHTLHKYPELSCNEINTKKILINYISKNTELEIIDKGHYFYAVYRATNPTMSPIAFRAEMDALPMNETLDIPYCSVNKDVAHKCGHDGHAASLAGFARVISEFGACRDIYFVFQHGEEIGAGGEEASECLVENSINMIYASHNWSGFKKNTIITKKGIMHCASQGITIRFTGSCAHASEPEHGANPSSAISQLALFTEETAGPSQMQRYYSQGRGLVLATIVNISVGTKDFGMAAGYGEISATIRAEKEDELNGLRNVLIEKANKLAAEYGLTVTLDESDRFPETISTDAAVNNILKAADTLGLEIQLMSSPIRASEDFGYFTKVSEGALFYVGNGEDYPNIHTDSFDFPDDNISTIINMFYELSKI